MLETDPVASLSREELLKWVFVHKQELVFLSERIDQLEQDKEAMTE